MTPIESRIIDLARKIAALDGGRPEVDVDRFAIPTCDAVEHTEVSCKCGETIKVRHECHDRLADWQVEPACTAIQDPDLALLLRELDLALVSLDLERIAS